MHDFLFARWLVLLFLRRTNDAFLVCVVHIDWLNVLQISRRTLSRLGNTNSQITSLVARRSCQHYVWRAHKTFTLRCEIRAICVYCDKFAAGPYTGIFLDATKWCQFLFISCFQSMVTLGTRKSVSKWKGSLLFFKIMKFTSIHTLLFDTNWSWSNTHILWRFAKFSNQCLRQCTGTLHRTSNTNFVFPPGLILMQLFGSM